MRAFRVVVYVLALVPLASGVLEVVLGLPGQTMIGAASPPAILDDPLMNSQQRFVGALWFGYGATLWFAARHLPKYSRLLALLLATVFLGGIGRGISLAQFGLPINEIGKVFVLSTTGMEIIGMPVLLWWQVRVKRGATH